MALLSLTATQAQQRSGQKVMPVVANPLDLNPVNSQKVLEDFAREQAAKTTTTTLRRAGMTKGAKRKDLAYAFINFVYDCVVAKVNMEYICGVNPVKPGIDLLDEKTRSIVIISHETLARGQVLRGLDDPKAIECYNKAWDKIKAVDAK